MPKKGKEPAGLRRWRLAHRKKGSHRSARSAGKSESHAPGFAATYQHGKTAIQILSPVTDDALAIVNGATPKAAMNDLVARAKSSGYRGNYAKGVAVSIVDAYASRKLRTTNALAQKSVTAIAPEAYALGTALLDQDLDPKDTHDDFVYTTSGFSPKTGTFNLRGKSRTYFGLKYGGVIVRKIAKAIPAVGDPLKKALNQAGLTL